MVEAMIYQTLIVCFTVIILVNQYLSGSRMAVNQWKGRYLTLSREVKKYEKTIKKEFSKQKKESMLTALNIDEDMLDQIIDFAEQYGIPESAINAIVDNPKIVTNLLSKVSKGNNEQTPQNSL